MQFMNCVSLLQSSMEVCGGLLLEILVKLELDWGCFWRLVNEKRNREQKKQLIMRF